MDNAPLGNGYSDRRSHTFVRVMQSLSAFALLLCFASALRAQQYESDPVDEKARLLSGVVNPSVKDPARYTTDKDRFLEYFSKYYFPSMTRVGPDDLGSLGTDRYKLFNDVLWKTRSTELQADLTNLAYERMVPIVSPKATKRYHPAVRYNAMLVLGLLDEQYPIDGKRSKPHRKATELLWQYVSHAAKGNRVEPSLLVGALVGLERHSQFHDAIERATLENMTAAVIKLATLEAPPPDVDSKVFEWMKFQSATILANLGSPGLNNASHIALVKLLSDPVVSLDNRCMTVALFEKIKYEGAKVDSKATADAVLQVAADLGKAEAKRATEFEEQSLGGGFSGGRGMGEGGRSPRRTSYSDEPAKFDRRTLLTRLDGLRRGLAATKPLVEADRQKTIEGILAAIRPVIEQAQDADVIDLDLASGIKTMSNQIQLAINPAAEPAAAAPAEDFSP